MWVSFSHYVFPSLLSAFLYPITVCLFSFFFYARWRFLPPLLRGRFYHPETASFSPPPTFCYSNNTSKLILPPLRTPDGRSAHLVIFFLVFSLFSFPFFQFSSIMTSKFFSLPVSPLLMAVLSYLKTVVVRLFFFLSSSSLLKTVVPFPG